MQLVGRDVDLSAEAVFEAIGKRVLVLTMTPAELN